MQNPWGRVWMESRWEGDLGYQYRCEWKRRGKKEADEWKAEASEGCTDCSAVDNPRLICH